MSSVATVMPEIGFDDEPISPQIRDETVTKKNPKSMMSSADGNVMPSIGASHIACFFCTS